MARIGHGVSRYRQVFLRFTPEDLVSLRHAAKGITVGRFIKAVLERQGYIKNAPIADGRRTRFMKAAVGEAAAPALTSQSQPHAAWVKPPAVLINRPAPPKDRAN
jgi:hypothetical protein